MKLLFLLLSIFSFGINLSLPSIDLRHNQNFYQKNGKLGGANITKNFTPTGTAVKFSESSITHEIYFESADSYMYDIIQENGTKVKFSNSLRGLTLKRDLVIEGNTKLSKDMHLNGHVLTINGNLTQTGGQMDVYSPSTPSTPAILNVNGNYLISGDGTLNMNKYTYSTRPDPQVNVTGDFTIQSNISISDGNGNKTTISVTVENAPEIGDVNCDGQITIADVVLLQKWLLAVPDIKLPYWKTADLCEDAKIDVFDLVLLKSKLIYG